MPRQARIDAPGALHHVIARGIGRHRVFADERDRQEFVERLAKVLVATSTPCYAWALIPNHFHLLLATGKRPVGRVMQALLTGYALYFNRRHDRTGHLFENRFKSILCEREPYLLELVRYIHLNPLRAGLVRGVVELDLYPWSGHAVLLGHRQSAWQASDDVLGLFGKRAGEARDRYRRFVSEGIRQGYRSDLVGGGLVRSLGGWEAVAEARRNRERHAYDERILGTSDFVTQTLRDAEERERAASRYRRSGWTAERILGKAAEVAGIPVGQLTAAGRRPAQSHGRALAACWLVDGIGMKGSDVARLLGISKPSVREALERGRRIGARLERDPIKDDDRRRNLTT